MKYYIDKTSKIEYEKHTLYRIVALESFSDVKKGDFGGYVESEHNLSQEGDCWIYDNAKVYENAKVCQSAKILQEARVFGNATVLENAVVYENAVVWGRADIWGNAKVYGNANIYENAFITDFVCVFENAVVKGNSILREHIRVKGCTYMDEYNEIFGDAIISSNKDYITFRNDFIPCRSLTWTRSNDMWSAEPFYGTGQELLDEAFSNDKKEGEMYAAYVELVDKLREIYNL